jgi:hypothetical protein
VTLPESNYLETVLCPFGVDRKVIEALAARDPEQARKAMHSHLSRAHDRWARRLESSKKSKVNNCS